MRILGVIDLIGGQVVRGVAGRRAEYRPVVSLLTSSPTPAAVAAAMQSKLGITSFYIADLDAIRGGEPRWNDYRAVMNASRELMIDAGLADARRAAELAAFFEAAPSSREFAGSAIAGLETVGSPALLAELLAAVGAERLVFSLDLKSGAPLTASHDWPAGDAMRILSAALEIGLRRFILLDLARVGTGEGVGTESLCRELRVIAPTAEIIAGGGVRGVDDLRALEAAGCDGVLIASALHDGRLTRAELARWLEE